MSYLFIQSSFVVLSVVCIVLIVYGLKYGISHQERSKKTNKWPKGIILGIFVWAVIISMLSYNEFFLNFKTIPPRMIFIMLPPLVFLILVSRRKTLADLLKNVPVTWLLYLQSFRFFVEVLLWGLYELGLIPIQMTFEGRNFDIVIGITAPIIAVLYVKGMLKDLFLKVWNIIGILVLANIVITAILSMPLPIRVFMNEPANTQVVIFPIVWLPAILVPIAYYLHVFSLIQLRNR